MHLQRDHAGIVRPVLEQGAISFQKPGQRGWAVRLQPGVKGEVMGPFEDVDGVHLKKSEPSDQGPDRRRAPAPSGGGGQALGRKENPPRGLGRNPAVG